MKNIVLLGAPGVGKGTLAKQLESTFNKYIITPGGLYRKEAKLGTDFGLRAKKYWGNGNLCPDDMTNELIKKSIILDNTIYNGNIFDGYPRTITQAKYLDTIIDIELIFDIYIPHDMAVKRLLRRSTIENRPDDTEDIIQQRISIYNDNNTDIVKYYQNGDKYHKINGEGTPEDTMSLVSDIINQIPAGE